MEKLLMSRRLSAVSLLGASLVAVSSASAGSLMNTFNVIVTENLQGVAEIEGRTFVGGNLAISNAAQFGFRLTNTQVAQQGDALVVGGNITSQNAGTVKVFKGNLRLGGTVPSSNVVEFHGGGSNQAFNYNVQDVKNELSSFSTFLRNLPSTTPTFAANGNGNGVANLAGGTTTGNFSALSINANSLFGSGKNYNIRVNPGTTGVLVINVAGTSINWSNGANMIQPATDEARSRIIWNFYEATSIHVGGKAFLGSLLAPLANLTSSGGDFNGSVAVRSMNISAEVHNPTYSGGGEPINSAIVIPLPGAGVAGAVLLGIATVARRRLAA
jgi:choice-of-anchor A domain-containing protein